MTDLRGDCLSGKVRYTITAEPVFAGIYLTARIVKKATVSAFNIVVAVPECGSCSVTGR